MYHLDDRRRSVSQGPQKVVRQVFYFIFWNVIFFWFCFCFFCQISRRVNWLWIQSDFCFVFFLEVEIRHKYFVVLFFAGFLWGGQSCPFRFVQGCLACRLPFVTVSAVKVLSLHSVFFLKILFPSSEEILHSTQSQGVCVFMRENYIFFPSSWVESWKLEGRGGEQPFPVRSHCRHCGRSLKLPHTTPSPSHTPSSPRFF